MPGSSDNRIEISIGANLDSSFEASTAKAAAQLDELAASAEASLASLSTAIADAQNTSSVPDGKGAGAKAADAARRSAGEVAQIWKQVDEKRLEGEEKANAALLALGEETVDAWKTQALVIEKAREDADARYLAARTQRDQGNAAALAKDAADRQQLAVESANRLAAIDEQYQEKKRRSDERDFAEFERTQENKVRAAEAANAALARSGKVSLPQADTSDLQSLDTAKADVDRAFATLTAGWNQESEAYKSELEKRAGFDQWYAEQKRTIETKSERDSAARWSETDQAILGAESQLVGDIFNKRQKLAADLAQVGYHLLQTEVANLAKELTEHEMANLGMMASDKAAADEGLLYRAGAYLLDQLGFLRTEAAKTQAVAAGVTLQNAAKAAGNAQGMALTTAAASKTIAMDAAQAASGTYQSVSQIPLVGWILAPIAAAGAFAAVAAYDSFAVGADNIPHDMVANIHKGEMIIPAGPAAAIRSGNFNASAMRGGDTYSRSDSSATTHQWNYAPTIQGVPERNVMDELRGNASEFASFVMGLQRNGAMKFS